MGDNGKEEQLASGEMELFSELRVPRALGSGSGPLGTSRDAVGLRLPARMWLLLTLLIPQLPVHAEFLPVLFPAAGVGGVCVRDLRLCEGECPSTCHPGGLLSAAEATVKT